MALSAPTGNFSAPGLADWLELARGTLPEESSARIESPADREMEAVTQVLLVHADAEDRALAAFVLNDSIPGISIREVGDGVAFAAAVHRDPLDMAIVGDDLPWADGRDVLELVKRIHPDCLTVLVDSAQSDPVTPGAAKSGVDALISSGSAGLLALPSLARDGTAALRPRATYANETIALMPLGYAKLNKEGRLSGVNGALAGLLAAEGLSAVSSAVASEQEGHPFHDRLVDEGARAQLMQFLAGGQGDLSLNAGVLNAHGDTMPMLLVLWHTNTPDTAHMVAISVTPPAPLGSASNQFEQLAYTVAHDLQEPLLLINQTASQLFERNRQSLDPDATRLINRLVESAERMQDMLSGVLEYATLGANPANFATVDLGEVLSTVLENLAASIRISGAQVQYSVLPSVHGDRRQLLHLLQNLISNAIKFRGSDPPLIQIDVEERPRDWLLRVADNGIGIEGRYVEVIFDMFKRLHTADEYPGTGIGLAVCRRIAQNHGGTITVRSMPGEGSTFLVVLSKQLSSVELCR